MPYPNHNQEWPTTVDPRELQRHSSQVDTRQRPIDLVRHVATGDNSYASGPVSDSASAFDHPNFSPHTFDLEEQTRFLASITDDTSTTGTRMDLIAG